MTLKNRSASVRARLLSKAREKSVDYQLVLTRYALERLLYRLSISSQKEYFLLKGALLFDLWYDVPLRPTHDIDLLGFGIAEIPHLIDIFEELCNLELDDGIFYDLKSIKVEEIRKEANYSGIRVTLLGLIDGAKCPIQVDIGYGDAVTPAPESVLYPVMLDDMPAPCLRVYPRYTVIAEKLEAIITLGMANTRMKDYFDLYVILQDTDIDRTVLSQAVTATLNRRKTTRPKDVPTGLSERFSLNAQKNTQWNAFVNRNKLKATSLGATVDYLRNTLAFLFDDFKHEVKHDFKPD
ncbi:nucleotidyl transferase AbiEii/AbiGii toxin family protein [Zwartia panacis]|uniref:nucleotidyl transferase AbiEii/AbiGii toxin family protein n=1 Tax=Zwartia panacis TaxID=2683345 RepID=UPI0025B39B96|nr:nucleotidyl transferase AbiEii/AbiGii toxin family protein [Zwartia panacis]MDN4016120.1 nucleotidyl transferase AbiEii/AbiGii toxin family protein [Zwartia panacis]